MLFLSLVSFNNDVVWAEDEDIRQQSMDGLVEKLVIDDEYLKVKMLERVELPAPLPSQPEGPSTVLTDKAIIHSALGADNLEKRINLDFDEVTLKDIFMTLGKAADINVLIAPDLRGQILDLHLKQVTLIEAFLLVSNAYDLGFKQVENSLYIDSREKLRDENLVSKVIKLRNINVVEAQSMVDEIVDKLTISEDINTMTVVGTPQEIVKVEDIIKRIDKPQPQVIIEAKVIEVNRDALKDLGVDWQDQISIDTQENGRNSTLSTDGSGLDSIFKFNNFQRQPFLFNTTLKMLENQNKAKILSSPRVSTLNDREAVIFIGDRIPYTITSVTGGVATTEVEWAEPGIRLTITPSIIEDDFVVMKVEPEVSFIFAFRGPNDEFPHIKTREATAFVRVKNNQPFIIGGLLSQEDKNNLFKVPFLGDVPLLGNLFSYEKHTIVDTELIITVIPKIISSDN